MQILVAEEDSIARQLITSTLRRWGHEVLVGRDRQEIRSILAVHEPPPIAILDWPRADLETPELFVSLQQLPPEQQPYIIVTTQRGKEQDLVAAIWAGADDYLHKPINIAELRSRVQVGERIAKLQARIHADSRLLRAAAAS